MNLKDLYTEEIRNNEKMLKEAALNPAAFKAGTKALKKVPGFLKNLSSKFIGKAKNIASKVKFKIKPKSKINSKALAIKPKTSIVKPKTSIVKPKTDLAVIPKATTKTPSKNFIAEHPRITEAAIGAAPGAVIGGITDPDHLGGALKGGAMGAAMGLGGSKLYRSGVKSNMFSKYKNVAKTYNPAKRKMARNFIRDRMKKVNSSAFGVV